jgi:hypothetical protein
VVSYFGKRIKYLLRLNLDASASARTLICTTPTGDGIQPNNLSLPHAFDKAIKATEPHASNFTISGTYSLYSIKMLDEFNSSILPG